jgi:hypothetical protein
MRALEVRGSGICIGWFAKSWKVSRGGWHAELSALDMGVRGEVAGLDWSGS